jgi:hypothetical protein
VTVDFATADGTAIAGSDYIAVSRTLSFPPGTTTTNVSVQVIGDTIQEPDEVFNVRLTNAVNATIARGQGQGAIRNDDNQAGGQPQMPQPSLDIVRQIDGTMGIEVHCETGRHYVIQTSINLVDWTAWADFVSDQPTILFQEPRATNIAQRFYRIVTP